MNVVQNGSYYDVISGDDIQVTKSIPAITLKVVRDRRGFHLMKTNQLEPSDFKVYGKYVNKIGKIFRQYQHKSTSTGVLLSGDKGLGKSLFLRELAARAQNEYHMPVIIVDTPYPGLADFIQSFEQDCMICFDEFDKTFKPQHLDDGTTSDPQDSLLSMFDGLSSTHHLNVITANNIRKLSDYLINRPGRFHYHIRFDYPSADEITEYLHDNLPESQYSQIDGIIRFSRKYPLNYDCLSAISDELQYDDIDFNEAIKDLNIINMDLNRQYKYAVEIDDANHTKIRGTVSINMIDDDEIDLGMYIKDEWFTLSFDQSAINDDSEGNGKSFIVLGADVRVNNGNNEIRISEDDNGEIYHVRNIKLLPVSGLYDFKAL